MSSFPTPIAAPSTGRTSSFKLLISLCACTLLVGCSSSTLLKSSGNVLTSPARLISSSRKEPPIGKILCLWEAAEGQGLDGKPTRGFAGQIMFFTHGEPSPVRVKGKVRVFEYADYTSDRTDQKPDHLFEFDNGAWNAHITDGTIGETYNVFLPYVKGDTGHATCALRVEYESPEGRVTSSPYTEVTLVSKTSQQSLTGMTRNVIHNSTTDPGKDVSLQPTAADTKRASLDSTTIKLPKK